MTACAGDPSDPSSDGEPSPDALNEAVEATRAGDSGRVELSITLDGPGGPVALVHRASYTAGGAKVRAESDLSQVAEALAAAGQPVDGDWTSPTGVVVDGDTVYSQLGPMAESLGRAPDDWAGARLIEIAGTDGAADNDTLALALDPLGPLDVLRRPVATIERVGDDEVRGDTTEHLRARLDLRGIGSDGGSSGSLESRLVASGIYEMPVDVWIAADGSVRRLGLSFDEGESLVTTFDVYDRGADIEVVAPTPVVGTVTAPGG